MAITSPIAVTLSLLGMFSVIQSLPTSANEIPSWNSFKAKFGKSYTSPSQEAEHKAAFLQNVRKVQENKQQFEAGLTKQQLGITAFSDIPIEKFRRTKLGGRLPKNPSSGNQPPPLGASNSSSSGFDWRDNNGNFVSQVRDQGQCGCCWAFAAISALESAVMISNGGQEEAFSEEQLVDCYKQGCSEGNSGEAWTWLQDNNGSDSYNSYPYTASGGDASSCQSKQAVQQVTGSNNLWQSSTSVESIQGWVQQNGPLAVGIDGEQLQNYKAPVFSCSNPTMNHFVTLIGWGTDDSGSGYWIIKNSWGTSFGDQGFGQISQGTDGSDCGISQFWGGYPSI